MLPRQKVADLATDNRGACRTATYQHAETNFPLLIFEHGQPNVMHCYCGAVFGCAIYRDLEFARQIGEFWMESAPLAQNFGIRTRVNNFICRNARIFIGRDVADAVAGGLNPVHFNCGKISQYIRCFFQLDPIELEILTGREVTIAPVVFARDVRKHAHLCRGHHAIGHSNTQHISMNLHIKSVLQSQRTKFIFGQFI